MTRVDLHVHSCYSNAPTSWLMQQMAVSECYTPIEQVYARAKERGMSFVTVTDHDSIEGALLLKERHPLDVFTGVETTATFPEDGCNAHVLIYDLTEDDFATINRLRSDIYALREYLLDRDLPNAVAHATFSVNGRLTLQHIEKMMLLFNVFEGINGGRTRANNRTVVQMVRSLTPALLEELRCKHHIEPWGDRPWAKGLIAGSDDHAGLFVGRTYTEAKAETVREFLAAIKSRRTSAQGRHNDYRALAFTLAKVAYDASQNGGTGKPRNLVDQVMSSLFESRPLEIKERFLLSGMSITWNGKEDSIRRLLVDLAMQLEARRDQAFDEKMDMVYDRISDIVDTHVHRLARSVAEDLKDGSLVGLLRSFSSFIPAAYVTLPFVGTQAYMHKNRALLEEARTRFHLPNEDRGQRVLWFTDTLNDMNGVSVTLKKIGWLASYEGIDLRIVSALDDEELTPDLPPNLVNLPLVHKFQLPYYEQLSVKVPALLKALDVIDELDADQIFISTPGPIGLVGLLASRLLGCRAVSIYHTDFAAQAREITGGDSIPQLCEKYTQWFYSMMDEILVPSAEYIRVLEARGFDPDKMRVFRRGIDSDVFAPSGNGRSPLVERLYPKPGFNLVFVGRVSQDKNLDFMADVYEQVIRRFPAVNWAIIGEGPYLPDLKERLNGFDRVSFSGRLERNVLPSVYSAADLLVFPSTTDTFGMAVLEAQSCGLPAMVSDQGGPQEIVANGHTGFVVTTDRCEQWVEKISELISMHSHRSDAYRRIREAARKHVVAHFNWDRALRDLQNRSTDEASRAIRMLRTPGAVA